MRASPYQRVALPIRPEALRPVSQLRPATGAAGQASRRAVPFVVQSIELYGESKLVLPGNPQRCYLLIVNKTATEIYVDFGRPATPQGSIPLQSGQSWPLAEVVPSNSINVYGDGLILLTEGAAL